MNLQTNPPDKDAAEMQRAAHHEATMIALRQAVAAQAALWELQGNLERLCSITSEDDALSEKVAKEISWLAGIDNPEKIDIAATHLFVAAIRP